MLAEIIARGHLREIGVPTVLAAIVVFVSAMATLGSNVSALRQSFGWVQRSNSILLEMAEINTLVMGIDMTVRGYALTDNPDFLVYEADNRDRLGIAIDDIAKLASDDPGLSANIVKLRLLVARQEEIYTQLSSLGPGHAKEVATAIADPATRDRRYAVQRALTVMHDREIMRLSERQKLADRQVSHAIYLALGLIAFASVAGAVGLALTFFGRRTAV